MANRQDPRMGRIAVATLSIGDAHIPQLGFGTYGMSGPKLRKVLVAALHQGFRHIDTAQMYQNEADVGAAILEAGVSRKDVFITTKVWVSNYPRTRARCWQQRMPAVLA